MSKARDERRKILVRVVEILKSHCASCDGGLTKEEWIELALDGGADDLFLDEVNKHLAKIAPEVFEDVEKEKLIAEQKLIAQQYSHDIAVGRPLSPVLRKRS